MLQKIVSHRVLQYRLITQIVMFVVALCMVVMAFQGAGSDDYLSKIFALNIGIIFFCIAWCGLYTSFSNYFFSSSFWLGVTVFFYFVLKSIEQSVFQNNADLLTPLSLVLFFCLFYTIGYSLSSSHVSKRSLAIKINWPRLCRYSLLVFIVLKLLSVICFTIFSAGASTTLDVAAETQNMGMAYLFRIFTLSSLAYYIILYRFYTSGENRKSIFLLTLFLVAEMVLNASRSGLIMLFFINLVFRHKYIKPVPILALLLLSPILVFLVSFFGYVRDIEIGNLNVYWNALEMMIDDMDLVFVLFMARMDVLPLISDAVKLYHNGDLHSLWGGSYIYSILHFIPRGVWADKPPLTAAYVTSVVRPGLFADGVNIYPSIVLEAYLNALWGGVAIVGCTVGFFCRKFDVLFSSKNVVSVVWCAFFFTFPMGLVNEGVHSNYFANMLYLSFLMYVFLLGAKKINAVKYTRG
jgi:oligosaccharide repeat unit polymerase